MCFGNQHTFTWGGGTIGATGEMPARLRCVCGVMSGENIAPLRRLQAENARLRERIEEARQYLLGAIDREVIACACWGASGCDAHELIHDLDQALAATAPAPAREGTS